MFQMTVLFSCLYFLVLTPRSIKAMTDEQKGKIKEHFETLGMECFKDFPVTEKDIADIRAKNPAISGEGVPCFMACVLKKTGMIDEAGLMQKETTLDMARKIFEDEEELARIEEFLHSCGSSVNAAPVSDGDKGCERAMLSYKCMIENKSKFGFDM